MATPFILRSELRVRIFLASCRSGSYQSRNRGAELKAAEAFGKFNTEPDDTRSMLESASGELGGCSHRSIGTKL